MFQKGNKLWKDNGSGRKGYGQEYKFRDFIVRLANGELTTKELLVIRGEAKRMKYGAMHKIAELALAGDTRILVKVIDKLLPNTNINEHTGADGTPLVLPLEVLQKNNINVVDK